MKAQTTEMEAIKIVKSLITEGFTVSYMTSKQVDHFIWSYLYENGLQYKKPINYIDSLGNECSAIVYQEK